jgi:hypothetical protein
MNAYAPITARGIGLLGTLLLFAGCGGGGTEGGGGGVGPPLVYSGNSNPALISETNAGQLVASILGGSDGPAIVGGLSISDGAPKSSKGLASVTRTLKRAARVNRPPVAPAVVVDTIEPCDGGNGSVRTTGTLNDIDGTGILTSTFVNCLLDGNTANGRATFQVDRVDLSSGLPTDSTISIQRMAVRGPGVSFDLSGSLRVQAIPAANTETSTENSVALDNLTGHMRKAENFVSVSLPLGAETVTGRVYHSAHGFVDAATLAPLRFTAIDQEFPEEGYLLLSGSENRRIRVMANSVTMVTLEVDANGDGAFETGASLKWLDLAGPLASNLADSDRDGMHDLWESANGLDPLNPADAGMDADGDGVSNIREYRFGSNPNNDLSRPTDISSGSMHGRIVLVHGNSDIVFDPVSRKIYAAIRANPGAVVPIDPILGCVGTGIPVGINPTKLAYSGNGQFLYVGLDGQNDAQRIALATQTVDLTFSLGSDPLFGPFFVEDMEVLPGSPQSVAISLKRIGTHGGVAVFDNGIRRGTVAPRGGNVIEFSPSAGALYGYINESSGFDFYRMSVDSSGVSVQDVFTAFDGNLINGFHVSIKFHAGLIFTSNGRAVDPVTRTVVGTFNLPEPFTVVEPDLATGRVFFIARLGISDRCRIWAFDISNRQLLGTLDVSGVTGEPGTLIRWGARGLAFRTNSGQVVLVEAPELIP